ncbi:MULTISPECIES: hypothetical protein [Nocardiopsis]|uniref:Uncharacterized protein n=1 Tax=Nocardiopsis sinuspersici TaxID=501010 RepID=A0A7Y9X987_9ACTN|nr:MULTISPECIES: hypothetical protein [Nocardiopsis]NYH50742.1 hypothetical protein [Nocardiopsis sinuspersici]
MIPHTPEAVTRRRRDPSAPADAPPLAPGDLVPHLRGLARTLRDRGADRTARGPAPSR